MFRDDRQDLALCVTAPTVLNPPRLLHAGDFIQPTPQVVRADMHGGNRVLGRAAPQTLMMANYPRDRREQFMQNEFKHYFPSTYVIIHCIALTILGCLAIAFQIVISATQYTYYYVGAGYWVTAAYLAQIIMVIVFYKYCRMTMYYLSLIVHFFAGFVSLGGLFILNLVGLILSSYACSGTMNVILSSGLSCNTTYMYAGIMNTVVGFLGFVVSIFYVFVMQFVFSYYFNNRGFHSKRIILANA